MYLLLIQYIGIFKLNTVLLPLKSVPTHNFSLRPLFYSDKVGFTKRRSNFCYESHKRRTNLLVQQKQTKFKVENSLNKLANNSNFQILRHI